MTETVPSTDPLLRVEDVHVSFRPRGAHRLAGPVRAVNGTSFELGRGETLGLVGESGSGKSTLARAVMRLVELDRGEVELDGIRLDRLRGRALREVRPQLQMVFQDPYSSLNPTMTVGESVAEPLELHRDLSREALRTTVAGLLDRVHLGSRAADRYPNELSGGQRQRVAIARAIATEPKLIVCDESLSALDVSTQNQIINLLEELQDTLGTAYLFIAHDLSVVRHIAHRVAVMYLGRIVESGPVERVFTRPGHPYTEALLSAIPIPRPRVQRGRTRITLTGEPPDPRDQPSGCAFHPRCPYVMERCRVEAPVDRPIDGGGSAACHLLDDPAAQPLTGVWSGGAGQVPELGERSLAPSSAPVAAAGEPR